MSSYISGVLIMSGRSASEETSYSTKATSSPTKERIRIVSRWAQVSKQASNVSGSFTLLHLSHCGLALESNHENIPEEVRFRSNKADRSDPS